MYSSGFANKLQHQILLPEQPVFSKVGRLFSPRQACRLGLKSKTAWDRHGYKLVPDAAPAGFVVTDSSRISKACVVTEVACLREITPTIVEVVSFDQGYLVYGQDQTTLKRKKTGQKAETSQVSATKEAESSEILETNSFFYFPGTTPNSLPSNTSPYVVEITNTVNNGKGMGTGVWLTVPKDLEIPETHRHLENEIYYYLHTILQGDFNRKHDRDRTTRINRKLMRSILGDATKESQARQWLLEESRPRIIYTDHVYSQGSFSKAYGLNPIYRKHLARWQVTNPRLANRIKLARSRRMDLKKEQNERQSELLEYLDCWAKRITIDLESCRKDLEEAGIEEQTYHVMPAENINHKDYCLSRDDYGRVHSPYTQLWRPFRKHLRFDGEQLQEIDIRNSQVVFLVKLLKENLLAKGQQMTTDQAEFISLVQSGQIYDYLLAKAKAEIIEYLRHAKVREARKTIWQERFLVHICASVRPKDSAEWANARRSFMRQVPLASIEAAPSEVVRDDFKRMLFADVFYGRPQAVTPLTELFRAEFPAVHGFICEQKQERYQELARNMQRAEADLMIDTVCLRLMKHHPEIPVVTIHDSILTTAEHLGTVRRIILDEFARIDLRPTLK